MFQDKIDGFSRVIKSPYRDTFPRTATKPFFPSTRDIDDLVTSDAILSDSFVTEFVTESPILSQLRQIALVTH